MCICHLKKWLALRRPNAVLPFTADGSISIATGLLLSVFPQLYNIPERPFDEYVHDNRGIPNIQGEPQSWVPPGIRTKADMISSIIKGALALMHHMIRNPQQNLMPQVGRRFNALYSTARPRVQPPTVDLDPVIDFKEAASWLSTKGLDTIIFNALLAAEHHETVGPTGKAFIAQIRLTSSFAEMTPYLIMKAFVNEGLSKASLLTGVGREIKAFIEAERALRQQHGDALFPYLKTLCSKTMKHLPPLTFQPLQSCKDKEEKD